MFLPFYDIYINICFPDLSRANARRRKLQRQLASGKTRIILVATFIKFTDEVGCILWKNVFIFNYCRQILREIGYQAGQHELLADNLIKVS